MTDAFWGFAGTVVATAGGLVMLWLKVSAAQRTVERAAKVADKKATLLAAKVEEVYHLSNSRLSEVLAQAQELERTVGALQQTVIGLMRSPALSALQQREVLEAPEMTRVPELDPSAAQAKAG